MDQFDLVNKLFELVQRDHSCQNNSCDIGLAIQHGYDAIAIIQFYGSVASDNDFNNLYDQLIKSYTQKEYKKQIKEFLKDMHSIECTKCNAWCRNWVETPEYCDNCNNKLK